jgi:hypothetical protein
MGSVWTFLRERTMQVVSLVLLAECAWWPVLGAAQDVDRDLLRLCSPPVREPGSRVRPPERRVSFQLRAADDISTLRRHSDSAAR